MVPEIVKTSDPRDFITDVLTESGYSDFKVLKTELVAVLYNVKDGSNYTTLRFQTTFEPSAGWDVMMCSVYVDNLTGEWQGEY